MATKLKAGDEVVVIAGAHRGKRGRLLSILTSKNRVIVEGVNMVKKHERKTQENPEGAITEREGSIHRSNVMLASTYDSKRSKQPAAAAE